MNKKILFGTLFAAMSFSGGLCGQTASDTAFFRSKNDTLTAFCRTHQGTHNNYLGRVKVDSLKADGRTATLYYNASLADYPMRADVCDGIYSILRDGTAIRRESKSRCPRQGNTRAHSGLLFPGR